jgi:hypothetical protein
VRFGDHLLDLTEVGDGGAIGDGFTPEGLDFPDDGVRTDNGLCADARLRAERCARRGARNATMDIATQVIDHNPRTEAGQ